MKISQSTRLNDNASADYSVMTSNAPSSAEPRGMGVLGDPLWDLADRTALAIQERMSKRGELGLPKLLDERRFQYGIPDEAFLEHCLYDRIYVWQIQPRFDEETDNKKFAGTSILKPETSQKRDVKESCRGVIVSAGLKALDNLRSNGADIGHVINFIRLSPWCKPVAVYNGIELSVLILRDGDLISSEDLQEALRTGECRIMQTEGTHTFVDKDGKPWIPTLPWIDNSY